MGFIESQMQGNYSQGMSDLVYGGDVALNLAIGITIAITIFYVYSKGVSFYLYKRGGVE